MTKLSIAKSIKTDTIIELHSEKSKKKIKDFDGKKGEITVHYDKEKTHIFCGIGDPKKVTDEILRSASASGVRKAIDLKRVNLSILDPKIKTNGKSSKTIMTGALLATYKFSKYLSEKPLEIKSIEFVSENTRSIEAKNVTGICKGVFLARDLVNGNAHDIHPQALAKEAKKNCHLLT